MDQVANARPHWSIVKSQQWGQSARVTQWEGLGTRQEQILFKKDEPETKEAQELTTSLEKIWGIKEHVVQLHKDGVDQIHHTGRSRYK